VAKRQDPEHSVLACHQPAYGLHDGAKVLFCSSELAKMFGESGPASVVGRDAISFIAPSVLDESLTAIALNRGEPYRSVGIKADGLTFPIEISAHPVRYRHTVARLFMVRDLSPIAVVVDDEPPVARLTGALMRRSGYQTVVCSSPLQALSAFRPDAVSVLISDITMPEMDGIEFVGKIREMDAGLPVILVSGFSDADPPENELTRFLPKPFTTAQLVHVLESLPERARASLA